MNDKFINFKSLAATFRLFKMRRRKLQTSAHFFLGLPLAALANTGNYLAVQMP